MLERRSLLKKFDFPRGHIGGRGVTERGPNRALQCCYSNRLLLTSNTWDTS